MLPPLIEFMMLAPGVIELGVNYLMARDRIARVPAFNRLRNAACSSRTRIGDVAGQLLETGGAADRPLGSRERGSAPSHRSPRLSCGPPGLPGKPLRNPTDRGSGQRVDPDQVAGRIAEGAVADTVRLIGRLLHDVGAAGLQLVEDAVQVVGGQGDAV